MKRRLPLVLLAVGSVVALSAGFYAYQKRGRAEVPRDETLAVHQVTLPNGLQAELVSGDCGESVAVAVLFAIGPSHDPPGQSGMAHVIENMFTGSLAAKRTIQSGSDHLMYSVLVGRDEVPGELGHLAALMTNPKLGEADFGAAKQKVLDDLAKRNGLDATLTAMTLAAESIQPSRGNGRRGGVASEVETIDLPAVEKFWRAHFTPANVKLVVLGKIDPEKVRAELDKALAAIPAGAKPTLRRPGESTVIGTLVMGDAPESVALAVPAPPPSDPLYAAFLALAARLRSEGSESHPWKAAYDPLVQPELLFVTGAVKAGEGAEPAAARIRADVTKVLERPLEPSDVAAARTLFGSFVGLNDVDPKACASDPLALTIARARRSQLGMDKLGLAAALESTAPAQLADAAALFGPRRTTTVIAGGAIR